MLDSVSRSGSDFGGQPWREAKLPPHLQSTSVDNFDNSLPVIGLLSRAPQPGRWLVYTNLDMSRYLEFAEADVLGFEQLQPEMSPFGALGGTRVLLKSSAEVTARNPSASESDEFDLDIRLADRSYFVSDDPEFNTFAGGCETPATGQYCTPACEGNKTDHGKTCNDVNTCVNYTCHPQGCEVTGATKCNQATCAGTCNQATCHTCHTNCATCAGATCNKGRTCNC